MGNESRFKIPENCREFGGTNFGKRRLVANEFIQEFTKHVAPHKDLDERNEEWTKAVRGRFIDICPTDCCAVPKDRCTAKGEFLVDYIWEEKEDGRRILLACESEWGTDRFGRTHWYRVEEDFEKLLAIKATFKVLIFSSNCKLVGSQGTVEGDFSIGFAKDRLEASLRNYGHHISGEVYIFIDFPQTGIPNGDGRYRSFIWIAKKLGKSDVKFEVGEEHDLKRPTEPEAQRT
jgi:hypothetical protein